MGHERFDPLCDAVSTQCGYSSAGDQTLRSFFSGQNIVRFAMVLKDKDGLLETGYGFH